MENTFPSKEAFYNDLVQERLSEMDLDLAKTVWKKFNCKNLKDYTSFYLASDTLTLELHYIMFNITLTLHFINMEFSATIFDLYKLKPNY